MLCALRIITVVCWTQLSLNELSTEFVHISLLATEPGSLVVAQGLCCQLLLCIPKLTPALGECVCWEQEFPNGDGEGPSTPSAQKRVAQSPTCCPGCGSSYVWGLVAWEGCQPQMHQDRWASGGTWLSWSQQRGLRKEQKESDGRSCGGESRVEIQGSQALGLGYGPFPKCHG